MGISYSVFDPIPVVARRSGGVRPQGYLYLGLHLPSKGTEAPKVDLEQAYHRVQEALAGARPTRRKHWREALKRCGDVAKEFREEIEEKWHEEEVLIPVLRRAAAGHRVLILFFGMLATKLREGTLVLIDELETHLHPGLLSFALKGLYEVLDRRDAFALIATHAPQVLQEIPSRLVRVLEVQGTIPVVRSIPRETFGEDLSRLLVLAFADNPLERNFQDRIREVFDEGGREAVLSELGEVPSAGVELFLRWLEAALEEEA